MCSRERLGQAIVDFEDGKVCELAAAKHAKIEADLRRKIEAELQAKL